MTNISTIIESFATLLVAIGALTVLFKIGGLIDTLSAKMKEWKWIS